MNTASIHPSTPNAAGNLPLFPQTQFRRQAADDIAACRILVVDDNPDLLPLVANMATRLGYHAATAEDALAALRQLKKNHYDVVITDYMMPFMDGFQLAEQIKENHLGTKVILMTGGCKEDIIDKLGTGSVLDELLFKPFDMQTIKEKIESVR